MTALNQHPYTISVGDRIQGRVTANPKYGDSQTSNCEGDIDLWLGPKAIALRATQTMNEATVCWNWPFHSDDLKNTIMLHKGTGTEANGSLNPDDYTEVAPVTNFPTRCLTSEIESGITSYMAVADSRCGWTKTTISI